MNPLLLRRCSPLTAYFMLLMTYAMALLNFLRATFDSYWFQIDLQARAFANMLRKNNRAAVGIGGVIDLFIGMLVIFYVLSALIQPTEQGVSSVTNALSNSNYSEVRNIKDLPKTSYLIGLISVVVGIIYYAWGRD